MTLYEKVLEGIIKNKDFKETGQYTGIPYPFPKLAEYIPLIERGHSIGFLSPTGNGKSKISRYIFIYHVYKFYKATGYKVKIVYFPLEDNKEKVYKNIICNYLKDVHNISVSLQELDSKKKALPEFIAQHLQEATEYFKEFESIVTILDGEHEPTRIFNQCKQIADNMGTVEQTEVTLPDGNVEQQNRYICDTHVVCLVDNLSNLDPEDGDKEHVSINKFAKVHVRGILCNFYGWTVVQVLQQDYQSDTVAFNRDGEPIVSKLEPSLGSVADAKRVSRSMHLVIGMFAPARYNIPKFPIPPKDKPEMTYDIEILGNRFRSLKILKSNDSDVGMRIGLLMDGISETFTELPNPGTEELLSIYREISQKTKYQTLYNQ